MTEQATPTVSVIVPNYNHARFLRQRIDSVLGQAYQDFEVILLDDCSIDESRAIIEEYRNHPKVRIEYNEKNSGSTFKQWNKGVGLAHGKYVWIAESDDYADERLLETLVARLDAEQTAVLAYCRSWQVSADGSQNGFQDSFLPDLGCKKWEDDFLADGREECRKFLIFCNTVLSASSVLFRREVYLQVGGADEKLVYCGDWKMWAAMALNGGTISYSGEALNYYRSHAATVTERSLRNEVLPFESLHVSAWILQRVAVDRATRKKLAKHFSGIWPGTVVNRQIPRSVRWKILRNATAIDYRAPLELVQPGLVALRSTIARRLRSLRTGLGLQ